MSSECHLPGSTPDDLIVFVHIPKTAGTTLASILRHQYGEDAIYKITMHGMSLIVPRRRLFPYPLVAFTKLRRCKAAMHERADLRVVQGHFDMSLARLAPARARFVTLLRDPVERAISHYHHFRRMSDDRVHPLAMRSSLAEWVGACGLVEMDNGQTRRLAGAMGMPVGRVSMRTLDKAKANLEKFAAVGLTERFAEFQVLMRHRFGWQPFAYEKRNVGTHHLGRAGIGEDVLALIEDCNRFDRLLYEFAGELFASAIAKLELADPLPRRNGTEP